MESFLWPLVIFHAVVGVVGLPGNALIILVYGRKRQMTSPQVFILALAVADLVVCLFTPVTIYHWSIRLRYTSDVLCRVVLTVSFVTVYNSCFLTSAIAVDRYQAICRPHRRWMTVRRAKLAAAICAFLALLVSAPVFAVQGVAPYTQESDTGVCGTSTTVSVWVIYLMTTVIYAATLCTLVTNIVLYGKMYCTIRNRAALRPGPVRAGGPAEGAAMSAHRPVSRHQPPSSGTRVVTVSQTLSWPAVSCTAAPAQSSSADRGPFSVDQRTQGAIASEQYLRAGDSNCDRRQRKLEQQQRQQQQQQQQAGASVTANTQNRTDVSMNSASSGQAAAGGRARTSDNPAGRARRAPPRQRLHGKTTKMLVITTAVFFATWIPAVCVFVLPPGVEDYIHDHHRAGYSLLYLLRFIFYLNHAANPFIYGFVNKRFREDCKKSLSALRRFCRA